MLVTHGLLEAQRDVTRGLDTLAALAVETRHLSPAAAARALVIDILASADRRDDCLALILDRPADAA